MLVHYILYANAKQSGIIGSWQKEIQALEKGKRPVHTKPKKDLRQSMQCLLHEQRKKRSKLYTSCTIHHKVVLTRTFSAGIHRVWKAFTTVEDMLKWYSPVGMTTPEVEVDLHVGGKYA